MAKYTKNLKLEIPDYTDNVDIPTLLEKNNTIIDDNMINIIELNCITDIPLSGLFQDYKYYNKSSNLIFIYNSEGILTTESPQKEILYINLEDGGLYYYDGTDMIKASGTGETDIIDNLTSQSKTSALSANQGRILNELLEKIKEIKSYSSTELSNWDTLYNELGVRIYEVNNVDRIGAPVNANQYGMLFVICGDTSNQNRFNNEQIYITYSPDTTTDESKGVFVRAGIGNWLKLNGTTISKKES